MVLETPGNITTASSDNPLARRASSRRVGSRDYNDSEFSIITDGSNLPSSAARISGSSPPCILRLTLFGGTIFGFFLTYRMRKSENFILAIWLGLKGDESKSSPLLPR